MVKFKQREMTKKIEVRLTKTDDITIRDLRNQFKKEGSFEIKAHYVITTNGELNTIRSLDVVSGASDDSIVILLIGKESNEEQDSVVANLTASLSKLYPDAEIVSYKE